MHRINYINVYKYNVACIKDPNPVRYTSLLPHIFILIKLKVTVNLDDWESLLISPVIKKSSRKSGDSLFRKYFHDQDSVVPCARY